MFTILSSTSNLATQLTWLLSDGVHSVLMAMVGDGVVDEVGDGDDDGIDDDEDDDGDVILVVAVVKYELQSTTHFASALRPCYSYLELDLGPLLRLHLGTGICLGLTVPILLQPL